MRISLLHFITPLAILLAGCGEGNESANPKAATPAPGSSSWPATLATDGGSFAVTIQPADGAIERNKHFALDVTLDPKGGTAENVSVVVDADMPAHQHGMNTKPEIAATAAPMSYRVEGMLFHMQGDWVITVDVKREGKTERAEFPVSVE